MTIVFTTIAKLYLSYMLCALPASKETKRPTVEWKAYQEKLPKESQWDEWGKTATGICIITGKASGYLLVIDFDDKGSRFQPWCQLLPQELLDRLLIVQTPSGGYHVYVRYEGETVGNVKLARRPEEEKAKTLIETRGEGGLVIAPPTSGYVVISGSLKNVPVVSPAEWEMLRNAAQSFDEMPKKVASKKATPKTDGDTSVETPVSRTDGGSDFAWFVESGEWRKHLGDLEALGWEFPSENDNGQLFFQTPDGDHSPGKQDGNIKDGVAYFFSMAPEPFENNEPYSIPHFFAGALFGDIGKKGLRKFAKKYHLSDVRKLTAPSTADIALDTKMPLMSAYKFLEATYTFNDITTLIYYADDYWQWGGNAYRKVEDREVKKRLLHFLERAEAFPVAPANLNAVAEMLKTKVFQSTTDAAPCWIGGESCEIPHSVADPSQLIFCKSQILNLADMGILPPSPHWLNTASLEFDYNPTAKCPRWLTFLDDIFDDDEESKQTLMDWMGLCLTPATKFQKAMFLIGKRRSGKGTVARTLQKIVGYHNTVSPSTSDFGRNFGLWEFIGKTLAVVSDARFANGVPSQIAERILNITGEDMITIDRKGIKPLTLRLQTKLMFLSNEVPYILDQSGALAGRFIFLKLPNSFYGAEDIELENKLSEELPGILCLAIQHLQNLLERGRFIQPETGKGLAERMTALSSPVGEFAKQLQPGMTKDEIWGQWLVLCDLEGRKTGRREELWNNLETAGYDYNPDYIPSFMQDEGWVPSVEHKILLKELYAHYKEYCIGSGRLAVSDKKLAGKLRNLGYVVKPGTNNVTYVHCEKTE